MTDTPRAPGRPRLRILASIAALVLSGSAAAMAWLTLGDPGGCADATPAVFSHVYTITSGTMEPTIEEGDRLWAQRRYYCTHEPERGDLAVFTLPKSPATVFVKRIVGLPGDRVQLKQARLYINGEPVARDWVESAIHAEASGDPRQRTRFFEEFPGHGRYAVEVADPDGPLENTEEIAVPAGQYFVLGDNRDNSLDSRMSGEFGLIPRDLIADRPVLVLWGASWGRIGRWIDGGG